VAAAPRLLPLLGDVLLLAARSPVGAGRICVAGTSSPFRWVGVVLGRIGFGLGLGRFASPMLVSVLGALDEDPKASLMFAARRFVHNSLLIPGPFAVALTLRSTSQLVHSFQQINCGPG
jgi:hypothetical protein